MRVKSLNDQPIEVKPYQSLVVDGIARGIYHNIQEVVTENLDKGLSFMVCPRVLKLSMNSQVVRVP